MILSNRICSENMCLLIIKGFMYNIQKVNIAGNNYLLCKVTTTVEYCDCITAKGRCSAQWEATGPGVSYCFCKMVTKCYYIIIWQYETGRAVSKLFFLTCS